MKAVVLLLLVGHVNVAAENAYGGIYIDGSEQPDLHIEGPNGGRVLVQGVDVVSKIKDCVTTASFEARLDAITNEFRSMADANKAAFQQGDQDAAAAAAAKITSLEAKNKELQALIDAMQADLDSTTTTTTTTSSTSTATTVTTSTITSSTVTTVTTVTTSSFETALTNYAKGTGGGGSKILPGKQGYKIVIDEIAICGVGGDNVGDNNPSGPSTWVLSSPNHNTDNTFSVTGNGGTPGTIFLGGTPPFDRGSPRCSNAQCGKGFAHKDINGQWVYASGADVTLKNTLLNDNDGEYCYGKTPDGKAMVDDHSLGHGTGRAWVMYHYERA